MLHKPLFVMLAAAAYCLRRLPGQVSLRSHYYSPENFL